MAKGWLPLLSVAICFAAFGENVGVRPWLNNERIAPEDVTMALNAIWEMTVLDASSEAATLQHAIERFPADGRLAAGLLIAVALEHCEQSESARGAYQDVLAKGSGTPYGVSAGGRLQSLEAAGRAPEELAPLYEEMAKQPAQDGWFLLSGKWVFTGSQRAAWESLIALRSDWLSVRLFRFLQSFSRFPTPYGYLFLLLMLTFGAQIVTLPLQYQAAKLMVQMNRLAPQIRDIKVLHAGDFMAIQDALNGLYKAGDVKPLAGCGAQIANLIFVIWMLIGMSSFAPQMRLDGARFFWLEDVTRFDLGVALLWASVQFAQTLLNRNAVARFGQSVGQLTCGTVAAGGVILAIAWYWAWPSYVLVFWGLLSMVGTLITRLLAAISSVTLAKA